MTIAKELDNPQDIAEDVIFPPSDLYSDEPPLETELHLRQIILKQNMNVSKRNPNDSKKK